MVNKFIGIGNVGKDPEIRMTQNGQEMASFSIGITESYKDKQGQKQSKTEWVNIVAFGGVVNIIKNYVSKGSKVYIEGSLQTNKYTDKQGIEKYQTKVILQGFGSNLTLLGDNRPSQHQHQSKQDGYQPEPIDDDIPF